jgi:hypothetical protein
MLRIKVSDLPINVNDTGLSGQNLTLVELFWKEANDRR